AFLHLWIGNNLQATGGPIAEAELRATLPEDTLEQVLNEPNQARRYNMLARDVAQSVTSDPAGTVARRLWAGLYFVFGKAWFDRQTLIATATDSGEAPVKL